jgi:hypothetical protein
MSDSNRSRSDNDEVDSYDQQQEKSERAFGEKKTSIKFAEKDRVFGEDSDEDDKQSDENGARNISSILKTAPAVEESKEKQKKLTHTDA